MMFLKNLYGHLIDSNSYRFLFFLGYLHLERAGKWIRFWCKIKTKILEIHSSKSSKSPENTVALAELNIVTLPKKVMEETNYFLFKLMWAEESLLFLARDTFEWKKWNEVLKVGESRLRITSIRSI